MAPLEQLLSVPFSSAAEIASTYHAPRIKRADGGGGMGLSRPETLAVMSVQFSFAALSVVAAHFAFYWFIKMKRGFRQDMIMLLIQSDMVKALWMITSPIFYFITQKPFSSNYAFCQVSGFFLTATIEASDIAVLLIAIHTALFILKGQHTGVAIGLQPYRRVAYTLWAVIPLVLAAVVPLTGASFVDDGTHCYLPLEPAWYREGLSWIPRYIIFGFIIVTYSWLYLYVYIRLWRFGEHQRKTSSFGSQPVPTPSRRPLNVKWFDRAVPPTPSINDHGLLSSTRPSLATNEASKLRQDSVVSAVSTLKLSEPVCDLTRPATEPVRHTVSWNPVVFGQDGNNTGSPGSLNQHGTPHSIPMSPRTQPSSFSSGTTFAAEHVTDATPTIREPEPTYTPPTSVYEHTQPTPWRNRLHRLPLPTPTESESGSRISLANLIAALRSGPPSPNVALDNAENNNTNSSNYKRSRLNAVMNVNDDDNDDSSQLPVEHTLTDAQEEAFMRRAREKMQRQMRLLFVYPAIYLLTWVAPFVAHVGGYDMSSAAGRVGHRDHQHIEPLVLLLFSAGSMCAGAAVDCIFFSAWERPWNHLRGRSFWENLVYRFSVRRFFEGLGFGCGLGGSGSRSGGSGRTREERVADSRNARLRRERERVIALSARRMETPLTLGGIGGQTGWATRAGTRSGTGTVTGTTTGQVQSPGTQLRKEWWDDYDEDGDHDPERLERGRLDGDGAASRRQTEAGREGETEHGTVEGEETI